MLKTLFLCKMCGSDVEECRKDGRFYEHRGVFILLPEYFTIPRCTNDECNQEWFTDQLIKDLETVLEYEYREHADLIKVIVDSFQHNTQK